jgi:hypothetical protein
MFGWIAIRFQPATDQSRGARHVDSWRLGLCDCDFGFSRLVDRLERQGTPSRL